MANSITDSTGKDSLAAVAPDGTFFTVYPDGTLEIRGKGWGPKRKKKEPPDGDRPHVCHLGSREKARGIAERVAHLSCDLAGDVSLQWL
jgi:hypothetical protein